MAIAEEQAGDLEKADPLGDAIDKVAEETGDENLSSPAYEEPAAQDDEEGPSDEDLQEIDEEQTEDEGVTGAAEGTTVAMRAVARQIGVGSEFIDLATTDTQLEKMIELARNYRAEEPKVESEPFAINLPEDEYSEKDPIVSTLKQMNDHYASELNKLTEAVQSGSLELGKLREEASANSQRQQDEFNLAFHKGLDGLDNDVLGDSSKKLNDNHHTVREAVFNRTIEMLSAGSNGRPEDVAANAAVELFPFLNNDNTRQIAVEKQQKRVLGTGGNSKPAKQVSSPEDAFSASLDSILSTVARR